MNKDEMDWACRTYNGKQEGYIRGSGNVRNKTAWETRQVG
jgi:hypothetical protein